MVPHDENSVRAKLELAKNAKLEAAKRKLHEGYQEYDNGMYGSIIDTCSLRFLDVIR